MNTSDSLSRSGRTIASDLAPIMAAVFAGFLVTGLALPVLPLHVSHDLGFGTTMVGAVASAQFAAAVVSRIWAGSVADRHGGKTGVVAGLAAAVVSGLLYVLSLLASGAPLLPVGILIVGRAVLGAAESFIITGGVSWGLSLVDKGHAGKVISWVGTAMFVALAAGGPLGSILFARFGFASIGLATMAIPSLVLLPLLRVAGSRSEGQGKAGNWKDMGRAVMMPGLGAALSSIGYGAILSFSSLYLSVHHWEPVWLAFSAFAAVLIVVRIFWSDLPDRYGGARVALFSVIIQAAGLVLLGTADDVKIAALGAAISGLGYALVFPGLGAEAVRNVPPVNRGLAMGLYTVCLDVAMAIGSPLLGWIAGRSDLATAYLATAAIVCGSVPIGLALMHRQGR